MRAPIPFDAGVTYSVPSERPMTARRVATRCGATCAVAAMTAQLACNTGLQDPCLSWKSPCVAPFDVAAWCGAHACTEDGVASPCHSGAYCNIDYGHTLVIPISEFASSLKIHDLDLSTWGSCGGSGASPQFVVAIDGIAASSSSTNRQFSWQPFPANPATLTLTSSGTVPASCVSIGIRFLDASCEASNPPPDCPL